MLILISVTQGNIKGKSTLFVFSRHDNQVNVIWLDIWESLFFYRAKERSGKYHWGDVFTDFTGITGVAHVDLHLL